MLKVCLESLNIVSEYSSKRKIGGVINNEYFNALTGNPIDKF